MILGRFRSIAPLTCTYLQQHRLPPIVISVAMYLTAFQPPSRFLHSPTLTLRHFAPPTKNVKTPRSNVAPPHIPPPAKIAVLGGGLAGLAVVYHLLHSTARFARKRGFDSTTLQISIFDPHEVGCGGASAAAAGLLHGFTPRVKKKVWQAEKGVNAARKLLEEVRQRRGGDIWRECGLVRLGFDEGAEEDYRLASRRYPKEIEFLQGERLREVCPGNGGAFGVLLKEAIVVNVRAYLEGLWEICEESGRVEWVRERGSGVEEMLDRGFDTVVVCNGAGVRGTKGLEGVPVTACKGQNLVLEGGRMEKPVIGGKYVVPDYFGEKDRAIAGATFEYQGNGVPLDEFLNAGGVGNEEKACAELQAPLEKLMPQLFDGWRVCDVNAGLRALPPRSAIGSIPIACRVRGLSEEVSCWVLTALGSRGLLHHAFLGRELARAVVAGNERHIPIDARRFEVSLENAADLKAA